MVKFVLMLGCMMQRVNLVGPFHHTDNIFMFKDGGKAPTKLNYLMTIKFKIIKS